MKTTYYSINIWLTFNLLGWLNTVFTININPLNCQGGVIPSCKFESQKLLKILALKGLNNKTKTKTKTFHDSINFKPLKLNFAGKDFVFCTLKLPSSGVIDFGWSWIGPTYFGVFFNSFERFTKTWILCTTTRFKVTGSRKSSANSKTLFCILCSDFPRILFWKSML